MLNHKEEKKLQQFIDALHKKEISLNISCYLKTGCFHSYYYTVSLTCTEGNSVYHCSAQGNGDSIEEALLDLLEKECGFFEFESVVDFSKYAVDLSQIYVSDI